MSLRNKIRVIGDGKPCCGLRIACQGRAREKEPRRGHIGPRQEGVSTTHERCYLHGRYRWDGFDWFGGRSSYRCCRLDSFGCRIHGNRRGGSRGGGELVVRAETG